MLRHHCCSHLHEVLNEEYLLKKKALLHNESYQERYLKDKSPEQYLIEHVAKGDRGDGVPNYLSADDTFVIEGGRQKPMRAKYIDILGNNIEDVENKLTPKEISHSIISAIEMDDRGFVNELNIWATNPFN